jgi:hypothetical protein
MAEPAPQPARPPRPLDRDGTVNHPSPDAQAHPHDLDVQEGQERMQGESRPRINPKNPAPPSPAAPLSHPNP